MHTARFLRILCVTHLGLSHCYSNTWPFERKKCKSYFQRKAYTLVLVTLGFSHVTKICSYSISWLMMKKAHLSPWACPSLSSEECPTHSSLFLTEHFTRHVKWALPSLAITCCYYYCCCCCYLLSLFWFNLNPPLPPPWNLLLPVFELFIKASWIRLSPNAQRNFVINSISLLE